MLINKTDIKYYTQFTLNIEDRIINPSILDAEEYDLRPTVGDAMTDKFLSDFPNGILDWNISTVYGVGEFVIYNSVAYKSLNGNTGEQPNLFPFDWEVNQLATFYYNFVKPYLVFYSYSRFLLWIGSNLTQYGLREINEETSIPVSDQRRAELIRDIQQKGSIWNSRLKNKLCKENYIFDTISYAPDCEEYKLNPSKTFGIRAVGVMNISNLPNNQKPINQTENDIRNGN
jgi:hypothetical protein